jgi:pimeloyl-ACP methyl ester carboxylesterase
VRVVFRFIAIVAAGLMLGGCGTFFPFQRSDEVIVRIGDKPEFYPAKGVAGAYASPVVLAALAYQDAPDTAVFGDQQMLADKALAGWRRVPLKKYECNSGRICIGEVGEQLWIYAPTGRCELAVVVFRGTVFTSFDDWFANFHWFHRLTPFEDYYDQARNNIGSVVQVAQGQGCGGHIVAVGHSLGGGLAQHVAYAHPAIKTVYAFDPSFVIGSTDFELLGAEPLKRGRKVDYVYEHGEILAFLRFIVRQFHPYEACNPRIRTVRFNTLTGSIINQHRIVDFGRKLIGIAAAAPMAAKQSDGQTKPAKPNKFNLYAGCPARKT